MNTAVLHALPTFELSPTVVKAGARPSWRAPRRWPLVLGVAAGLVYAVMGLLLLDHGNYAIGDAVVRSANARAILFGRDPHLGAIGMVWMPLAVLVQLPFMVLLQPIGAAWASGPLSSALAGGATVTVLAGLGHRLGLRDSVATVVVALYALNPVTVLYSASGMSDPLALLFLALAASAYLRWSASGRLPLLALAALAIALATLTRYEFAAVAVLMAGAAAVGQAGDRRRRMASALVVLLPTMGVLVLWFLTSHVLRGDAFYGLGRLKTQGTPPLGVPWLPAERNVGTSVGFVVERVVRLAPALLVLVPLAIVAESRRATRLGRFTPGPSAVAVAAIVIPAYVGVALLSNTTYGAPRFFLTVVTLATVLALWLLGSPWSPARTSTGLQVVVIASLAFGCVTGTLTELDRRFSPVASEDVALRVMFGGEPAGHPGPDGIGGDLDVVAWREMVNRLDSDTAPGDLVVADTTVAFPALLFTDYPRRLLVPEDRSFGPTVARRPIRYQWVLDAHDNQGARGLLAPTIDAIIDFPPSGMTWTTTLTSEVGTLYHLEPSSGAPA